MDYKNRVIGLEYRRADGLQAHPMNWRTHPAGQKTALEGVLAKLGWAGVVIYNQQTGRLLDGHLRAEVAGSAEIPVLVVDLAEDEETLFLST
jgi:hypothetical protein